MNTIKQIRQQVVEILHPTSYKQVFAPLYQKIQTEVHRKVGHGVNEQVWGRMEKPVREQAWWKSGWQVKQGLKHPKEDT